MTRQRRRATPPPQWQTRRCLSSREPHDNRRFCYVNDVIDGMLRLMDTAAEFTGPVNLGNPSEFAMLGLAEKIIKSVGGKASLNFKALPQDDPKQRQPDISLAKQVLDWKPRVSLHDGLKETAALFPQVVACVMSQLTIVTPVYEDRDASSRLFRELCAAHGEEVFIVAVDDDSVREPIEALSRVGLDGVALRLKRNVSHQHAIGVGLGYVAENLPEATCVLMDSDGEDLPVTIRDLLACLNDEMPSFCGVVAAFQALSLFSWADLMGLNATSGFLVSVVMQAVISYFGNKQLVFKKSEASHAG